jgi:hypothetical protein
MVHATKNINMKSYTVYYLIVLIFSCQSPENLITNQKVGPFEIGEPLVIEYDLTHLELILDESDHIRTITILKPIYKTIDSFTIGTNFETILNSNEGLSIRVFGASKGDIKVINFGNVIVDGNIIFGDKNEDNIVDYIIVSGEE